MHVEGHFYTTQRNAWMDARVWREYLREVVAPECEGPSAFIVDNLDAHVSAESSDIVHGVLNSLLVALPPNSTSVCQPLDVGVMGPLKKMVRAELMTERKVTGTKARWLTMVKRTIKVWEQLSSDTVQSSFSKALPVAIV